MLHIITPFSRREFKKFYEIEFSLLDIIWHPIINDTYITFKKPWIQPFFVDLRNKPKGIDVLYYKFNMFIMSNNFEDDDKYCFINDDDMIDLDVVEKIKKMEDHVIFISMKRGDHDIKGGHPCKTLIANEDVHCGTIGVEQYFLSGKILKQIRFRADNDTMNKGRPSDRIGDADGFLAEELMQKFKVRYEPDLFVKFNLLEPGRWDNINIEKYKNIDKKIIYCIPTVNRYDLCIEHLKSIASGTLIPYKYVVIDNGNGNFKQELKNKNIKLHAEIEILHFGKNFGCAASWNYFLKNYQGTKIIANDDFEFSSDFLEKFMDFYYYSILHTPEAGIISIEGANLYNFFILTDECIEKVGYFDENFYPAYYEDNDHARRMALANLGIAFTKNFSNYYKHYKSSTIKAYNDEQLEKHHNFFNRNKNYYINKWGGNLGEEKYINPYNNSTLTIKDWLIS